MMINLNVAVITFDNDRANYYQSSNEIDCPLDSVQLIHIFVSLCIVRNALSITAVEQSIYVACHSQSDCIVATAVCIFGFLLSFFFFFGTFISVRTWMPL